MITSAQLRLFDEQSIETTPQEQLRNLSSIRLDKNDAPQAVMLDFLSQIGNPYCFLAGNTPVKIRFSEDGKPMYQALEDLFLHLLQE